MRGHKPGVAEIEEAVRRQRARVEDAGDRHRRAALVSGYGAAIEARRVLEGALKRLDELEAQLAEAQREEKLRGAFGPREGIREPATFVCGAGAEQDAALEVPRAEIAAFVQRLDGPRFLSGDPGDEDEHVSARRGVQIHVRLIMQYRSRFVHATPHSADELAARQRVELLQGRLQELIDEGLLEGYKVEQVEYDVLQKGA